MLDLLIRNAALPDGRAGMDIAIEGGRIVELRPQIDAPAREVIDAGGLLVAPPFVDSHFHMDSTLSLGQPRLNESGTLLEGIQIWSELKPDLTAEAIQLGQDRRRLRLVTRAQLDVVVVGDVTRLVLEVELAQRAQRRHLALDERLALSSAYRPSAT